MGIKQNPLGQVIKWQITVIPYYRHLAHLHAFVSWYGLFRAFQRWFRIENRTIFDRDTANLLNIQTLFT